MNPNTIMILTLIATTTLGLLLGYLGLAWIYEGYGLNPYIAFPAALFVTTVIPYAQSKILGV